MLEPSSYRSIGRRVEKQRMQHQISTHPYQRFPIERVERAVADVPLESFSEAERDNLEFGSSFAYW